MRSSTEETEPIFEADFEPVSYGFRPNRRAQDAIAEIHYYGTRGYRWVLDADIEACFDRIDHTALMDRVRLRVRDKRVLMLVKAFLKAGIFTELGEHQDTMTGTPQGGIVSPLLANVALSVLDEQVMAPWKRGGTMASEAKRAYRRRKGLPTWRIVRYADDFVVLVHGTEYDAAAMREQILRGWSNCFKHAVAKNRFAVLQKFVWKRMIVMLQTRHRWNWTDIRRRYTTRTGRWLPITAADGTVLFDLNSVTVSRYCWRGLTAETVESPLRREAHGGFGERFGETEQEQSRHRAPGLLSDLALCCSVAQQGSLSYLTELSNLFSLSRRTPFRNRQRVSRCSAGASTRRSHV